MSSKEYYYTTQANASKYKRQKTTKHMNLIITQNKTVQRFENDQQFGGFKTPRKEFEVNDCSFAQQKLFNHNL